MSRICIQKNRNLAFDADYENGARVGVQVQASSFTTKPKKEQLEVLQNRLTRSRQVEIQLQRKLLGHERAFDRFSEDLARCERSFSRRRDALQLVVRKQREALKQHRDQIYQLRNEAETRASELQAARAESEKLKRTLANCQERQHLLEVENGVWRSETLICWEKLEGAENQAVELKKRYLRENDLQAQRTVQLSKKTKKLAKQLEEALRALEDLRRLHRDAGSEKRSRGSEPPKLNRPADKTRLSLARVAWETLGRARSWLEIVGELMAKSSNSPPYIVVTKSEATSRNSEQDL